MNTKNKSRKRKKSRLRIFKTMYGNVGKLPKSGLFNKIGLTHVFNNQSLHRSALSICKSSFSLERKLEEVKKIIIEDSDTSCPF